MKLLESWKANHAEYKKIYFRTDSELQIREAEKIKARLENEGFNLLHEECGMFHGKFIYKRIA